MRRVRLPRELLLVIAAACTILAVFLGLVAVDVARWRTAVPADDIRFRVRAGDGTLWQPATLAPLGAGKRVLAIEDDLAFRHMLQDLRASRLRVGTVSDPALALRRSATSQRLESIVVRDPDPTLRSRASTLLGVLSVAAWNSTPDAGAGSSGPDRSELLLSAVASFEQAILLDPENADAKYNLQLMLQRGEGLLPTEASAGKSPTPGGRGSRGAGAGGPGSGY
jgi:hypothetical protein